MSNTAVFVFKYLLVALGYITPVSFAPVQLIVVTLFLTLSQQDKNTRIRYCEREREREREQQEREGELDYIHITFIAEYC